MSDMRDLIVQQYGSGRDIAGRVGVARVFNLGPMSGVRLVVTRHTDNLPGRTWGAGTSSYDYVDLSREQAKALVLALAEVIREGEE